VSEKAKNPSTLSEIMRCCWQILEAADRVQALDMKKRALDIIVANFSKVNLSVIANLPMSFAPANHCHHNVWSQQLPESDFAVSFPIILSCALCLSWFFS